MDCPDRRNPFVNQVSFFRSASMTTANTPPGRNPFVNQVSFFMYLTITYYNLKIVAIPS